jgi:shikimate kinase
MNLDDKILEEKAKCFINKVLDDEQKRRVSYELENHPDRTTAIFEERWRLLNEAAMFFLDDGYIPIDVVDEIVSFIQAIHYSV